MGECKAGVYQDNMIVTHSALMCHGGFNQPPCEHLEECATEHGMKKRKPRKRKIKTPPQPRPHSTFSQPQVSQLPERE